MDKSHPLSSLIVVHSLKVKKDMFFPKEDRQELLGSKVPYFSAISALIHLENPSRPYKEKNFKFIGKI